MTTLVSPARPSDRQGVSNAIAAGLVLALAAASWVPHLPASLWLDETLTYWVVKDGLGDALSRAVHYQPQPAYYAFMWLWTSIAGTSEIALRLPSLLAMLGACVAMARLGERLSGDRETGLLALVVFASTYNVFRESVDARPYAFCLLVLLTLALSVLRWIEAGRWRDAWLCGVLAALLTHLQVFFALALPAFALLAVLRRRSSRIGPMQVGLVGLLLLIGGLLYLPTATALAEHAGSYSFTAAPKWGQLFGIFGWVPPVAGLLAGVWAAGILGSRPAEEADSRPDADWLLDRDVAWMLGAWVLVPLLLLFGVSILSQSSIFLGRYLMPAIPAVCLLYAIALRAIPSPRARIVAAVVVALAAFATHERPADDFRGATRAVNEFAAGDAGVPVLLASGLIEGQDVVWLRDPSLHEYLNAPASYYPLEGRVITAPRILQGHPMAAEVVDPVLRSGLRFAAIEWYGNGANIMPWLIRRAEGAGYQVSRRGFGAVRVAFFRLQEPSRR